MAKNREQIERCLAIVQAYEASGQKAGAWAASNGVSIGDLSSWCAHADRWRGRLGLRVAPQRPQAEASTVRADFVQATMPSSAATAVRVEWPAAAGTTVLHWPVSHARELLAWLREVAR